MAAPSYVNVTTGATDAGSSWVFTGVTASAVNNVVILQILQDGPTSGAVSSSLSSNTYLRNLNNDISSKLDYIGAFPVGASSEAIQHLWIGRAWSQIGAYEAQGTNSTSEDLYCRFYEFSNVSTGTTLSTVIENSTAGSNANGADTSATANDTGVTTLGPDRLALNFVAVDDDNAIAVFTGQSGGTWVEVAEYAESSGTDGSIQMQYATMASAGTINGGTASITAIDNWGVIGFALIGTTPPSKSVYAQAQVKIKAVGVKAYAQARTWIKQTYPRASYANTVLADSPTAYWRLGEPSGTNANDEVGTNDATYVDSPTLGVEGAVAGDTAVLLNGSTQYLTTPDVAALNLGDGPLTVEAWAKLTSVPAGTYYQVFRRGTNSFSLGYNGDTGDVPNTYYLALAGSSQIVQANVTVTDTGWHHVVVTKDGATSKVYIDGVDRTGTVTNQTLTTATGVGNIGRNQSASQYYPGQIDEVAVYETVLSLSQVQAHYNARTLGLGGNTFAQAQVSINRIYPWEYRTRLVSSDIATDDRFGRWAKPSADGSVIVVGASQVGANRGAVYVYSGTNWTTETKLTASNAADNDYFGLPVDISDDGSVIIVGGSGVISATGKAYIYSGTNWGTETILPLTGADADDRAGRGVAISGDGTVAVVGGFGANTGDGKVWIYSGTSWATETIKTPGAGTGSNYGWDVDASYDGSVVAAGGDTYNSGDGAIAIFSGTSWGTTTIKYAASSPNTNEQLGLAVAVSSDGTIVYGTAWKAGTNGKLYKFSGASWGTETGYNLYTGGYSAQGDYMGISADGEWFIYNGFFDATTNAPVAIIGPSNLSTQIFLHFTTAGVQNAPKISSNGLVAVVGDYTKNSSGEVLVYSRPGNWRYAQAQAQITTSSATTRRTYAQAQTNIKVTTSNYAQSQAQIKGTYRGYAQGNTWVKVTDIQSYAQAQTSIKQTYKVVAQAQSQIKTTYRVYAQAQSHIKQTYQWYAQSQAQIIIKGIAKGQTNALINGDYTSLIDTFNRTVSNGWGTADTGNSWTVELESSAFSIDGTKASIIQAVSTSPRIILSRTYISGAIQISGEVSVNKLPTVNTETLLIVPMRSAPFNLSYPWFASYEKLILEITINASTLLLTPRVGGDAGGSSSYSYTPNDIYRFIVRAIPQTSSSRTNVSFKFWKTGDAEPSWTNLSLGNVAENIRLGGYPGVGFYATAEDANLPITWTLDNLNIESIKPQAYAQAQANIKQTYRIYAQAQAKITVTNQVVSQAQAQILVPITTYTAVSQAQVTIKATLLVYAQANTWVKQTYLSYAQAQAQIKQTYPFGGETIVAYDTFTEVSATTLDSHTADIGGSWTRKSGSSGGILINYFNDWAEGSTTSVYALGTVSDGYVQAQLINDNSVNYNGIIIRGSITNDDYYMAALQSNYIYLVRVTNGLSYSLDSVAKVGQWTQIEAVGQSPTILKVYNATSTVFGSPLIEVSDNTALNQTASGWAGITGGWDYDNGATTLDNYIVVNGTPVRGPTFAQSQARIKQIYSAVAQAQTSIKNTYISVAQGQAHIKNTYIVNAQALASIKQTYQTYAQAQSKIINTYQGYAQAQVKISTIRVYAQAQGTIKATYFVVAQTLAYITGQGIVYAQAKTHIKTTYPKDATYRESVLFSGPFTYWRLGDSSSTLTNEIAGFQTMWVYNSPTLQVDGLLTADSNKAIRFDKETATYGYAPGAGIPAGPSEGITIEAWVKFDSLTSPATSTIIRWGVQSNTVGYHWLYYVQNIGADTSHIAMQFSDGTLYRVPYVLWQASIDTTYHIVVSHNYITKEICYYINGILLGAYDGSAWGSPLPVPSGLAMWVANYTNTTQYALDGVLDELAIYNYTLKQSDVTSHFEVGKTHTYGPTFAQAQALIGTTLFPIKSETLSDVLSSSVMTNYSSYSITKNTYEGPILNGSNIQDDIKEYIAGESLGWISNRFKSINLSGNLTISVTMNENSLAANATARVKVERFSANGAYISTIVDSNLTNYELPTSLYRIFWKAPITPTTLNDGDRLRLVVLIDDALDSTMVSGYYAYFTMTNDRTTTPHITFPQTLQTLGYEVIATTQALIKANVQSYAQAQAQIKQSYIATAQSQTYIKLTVQVYAQAEASILATSSAVGQANAQVLGEAVITKVYAQAQAHIKGTSTGLAQAQTRIKQTYQVVAQSNAAIKSTYIAHAQSQAHIKTTYRAVSQAATWLKVTGNVTFAQAQARIVATYKVVAQANTQIKRTYLVYAQSQARIKNTYQVVAQAQVQIKQTYLTFAQAQVLIKNTYRQFAQSNAQIKQVYTAVAQAAVAVKQTYAVSANAQAQIKATYFVYAQANAYIKLIVFVSAQAQTKIKATSSAVAQAQVAIKTTYHVVAQAQTWMEGSGIVFAQAQAAIKTTTANHAQAIVFIYIPQYARPISDISNNGWVRVVI